MTRTVLLFLSILAHDDPAAKSALERFKSAYAAPLDADRVAAVKELSSVQHDLVLKKLAALLGADVVAVRAAAAAGLGAYTTSKRNAVGALVNGLAANAKDPVAEAAILRALGALKEEMALPTVHRYFGVRDVQVATAAVQAARSIGSAQSVDPLMTLLKSVEKVVKEADRVAASGGGVAIAGDDSLPRARALRAEALTAMQSLSGGEKWTTTGEWEIWWARKRMKAGRKVR